MQQKSNQLSKEEETLLFMVLVLPDEDNQGDFAPTDFDPTDFATTP